jgi:hypothetical protein
MTTITRRLRPSMRKPTNLLLGATFACILSGPISAIAANQAQINTAIDNGLAYLAGQQAAGGYWPYGGYEQAATGAAAFSMLTQKGRWGTNAVAYQANVDQGISYLLQSASTMAVTTRNDGANVCPGGGASCTGVYWSGNGEATYTTGQVAMAIAEYGKSNPNGTATTSGPLANMTWKEISQGVINAYAASQSTAINGNRDGGWRYYIPGDGDSDMSTTQWAVLASIYGQSIGATTPQTVTDHLKTWLAAVQSTQAGFVGAGCYQPGPNDANANPCEAADTGGLLLSLKFTGASNSDPAVQSALKFLNDNWKAFDSATWYGNFNQPYAMWAQYKGLDTSIGLADTSTITNLLDPTCGGNSPTTCNWWQDYNNWLVGAQAGNGSWSGSGYWTQVLATSYNLSILGGTAVPFEPPPASVPEPATLGLVALALLGLVGTRRAKASV